MRNDISEPATILPGIPGARHDIRGSTDWAISSCLQGRCDEACPTPGDEATVQAPSLSPLGNKTTDAKAAPGRRKHPRGPFAPHPLQADPTAPPVIPGENTTGPQLD